MCLRPPARRSVVTEASGGGWAVLSRTTSSVGSMRWRPRPAGRVLARSIAMVRAAAAALTIAIDRAKTRPAGRGRHLILPTELVVRDSTAHPPPDASVTTERRAGGRKHI